MHVVITTRQWQQAVRSRQLASTPLVCLFNASTLLLALFSCVSFYCYSSDAKLHMGPAVPNMDDADHVNAWVDGRPTLHIVVL